MERILRLYFRNDNQNRSLLWRDRSYLYVNALLFRENTAENSTPITQKALQLRFAKARHLFRMSGMTAHLTEGHL